MTRDFGWKIEEYASDVDTNLFVTRFASLGLWGQRSLPLLLSERRHKAKYTIKTCVDYIGLMIWFVPCMCSLLLLGLHECRDGLALDPTKFHLLLECFDMNNSREEMRLTIAIAIEGREPSVPLPFGSFSLCERNVVSFSSVSANITEFLAYPWNSRWQESLPKERTHSWR